MKELAESMEDVHHWTIHILASKRYYALEISECEGISSRRSQGIGWMKAKKAEVSTLVEC